MATTLIYLIPYLRLQLGDINPASYRYDDTWLEISLQLSVKSLGRWWNFKYLLDTNNEIYRNPNTVFLFPEPPIIEVYDERAIILMASIIIKEGSLENNSWNVSSWKDAEISYSNLEGNRAKLESLKKDWDELLEILTPPTKRLAYPTKSSLPGYRNNQYEYYGNL